MLSAIQWHTVNGTTAATAACENGKFYLIAPNGEVLKEADTREQAIDAIKLFELVSKACSPDFSRKI